MRCGRSESQLPNYVLTSKGPRDPSQVFSVAGGSRVRRSDVASQMTTLESTLDAQAAPGGWQSWTDWRNAGQTPVSTFVATWRVPPAPTVANGQLIYLFNGLQDAQGAHILQPVLQWGFSPARGSGYAWGLASFWVGGKTDPMFCTEWVPVAPGTPVTGRMTVAPEGGGLFSCTCEFDGYPGTLLTAESLPALVDCTLTLEAYNAGRNAPYPQIAGTDFTAVGIATGATTPAVRWTRYGAATVNADGSVEVIYPTTGA